jgi:MFS transporter, FLVCR family, MFS-domain-containing protein 7
MTTELYSKDGFRIYRVRWAVFAIFCFAIMSNAVLFCTFAPISDISSEYFGCNSSSINLLATIFLILYPFGTVFGIWLIGKHKLRVTLLTAIVLNCVGTLMRVFVGLFKDQMDNNTSYVITFFGQAIAGLSYPILVNLPAAIAGLWFPIAERDITTTIGAIFNPIGNAVGQILPTILVSKNMVTGAFFPCSLILYYGHQLFFR